MQMKKMEHITDSAITNGRHGDDDDDDSDDDDDDGKMVKFPEYG